MSVAAILMAAGGSRRLGRPKQLVEVEGRTLVRRTAELLLEAGYEPVVVVLGAVVEPVRAELAPLPVDSVAREGWQSGMAGSIGAGLAALPDRVEATLVTPCDLPKLELGVLAALKAESGPEALAACAFAGTLGPPALFGRRWFDDLARLEGDGGAKSLLRRHGAREIPWPEGAEDLDE